MKSFINISRVAGVHSLVGGAFTDAFPVWSEQGLAARFKYEKWVCCAWRSSHTRSERKGAAELWKRSQTATCVMSGRLDRERGRATMKVSLQQRASADFITGSRGCRGVQWEGEYKTTTEAIVLHSCFYRSRSMHWRKEGKRKKCVVMLQSNAQTAFSMQAAWSADTKAVLTLQEVFLGRKAI